MMEELPYDFRKTGSNQHFNIWIKLTIRFLYISGCVVKHYYHILVWRVFFREFFNNCFINRLYTFCLFGFCDAILFI